MSLSIRLLWQIQKAKKSLFCYTLSVYLRLKKRSGPLPTSEYILVDKDEEIGFIQIRHTPSSGVEISENLSSHIYYEVKPKYRGQDYGNKILKLGLEKALEIGLEDIFITCKEN